MLGWRTQANHSDNAGKEPIKEVDTAYPETTGIDEVGIETHKLGEIVSQIINKSHLVVSISRGKLYPLTAEDLVVGKVNAQVQRNAEKYGDKYTGKNSWGWSSPQMFLRQYLSPKNTAFGVNTWLISLRELFREAQEL